MNRQFTGLFGLLAAASMLAVACKDTPVATGDVGTPVKLTTDLSAITFQGTGKSVTVTAKVLDGTSTPLSQPISVASCNSATATAAPAAVQPVPSTSLAATVTSTGLNATCVVFTSNGVAPDTVNIIVMPTNFPGVFSASTLAGGDTLVIKSTATLKFNPANVTVSFPAGASPVDGVIIGVSADSIALLVPFGSNGTPTITGVQVTYVSGLEVSLAATTSFKQTGELWTGYNSWQTAPDITGILPASGGTSYYITALPAVNNVGVCPEAVLGFGSAGPCAMFKFTVAASTTLNFTVDWQGASSDPDVDIYSCSDSTVANFGSACFEDGGAGATGKKPQATGNFAYPAGTHWFVIENFCSGDPTEANCSPGSSPNNFVTITRP